MTEEWAVETLDTNEPGLVGSGAMGRALDQGTHREATVAQGGGSDAGDGSSGSGTVVQSGQNQGSATGEAGLGWGREEEMNLFGPPPQFK